MKSKWILPDCSIGVVAYMFTDIVHEVLGHGGTAVLLGHPVDLISSVYFRSHPGSFIADLGGPLANLICGLLIYAFLTKRNKFSPAAYFLLINLAAYNFFWFSGTILESTFSRSGDWTFAIKTLPIGALAKPALLIAGLAAYYFSARAIRRLPGLAARPFRYAYFAAAGAATVAGAFYGPDRTHAALEGFLEAMGLLPILFIVPDKQTKAGPESYSSGRMATTVLVFVVFIAFCCTIGRGI